MADIIKRCDCGDDDWDYCPHPWVVRYCTEGGRSSRQREESFGDDRQEAEDFLLKIEHDKKAHVFIDPKAGRVTFREEIKALIAAMKRKGLSASRIGTAHLVINAVFTEAVRNKKLSESPCTDVPVPDVVHAADVTLPTEGQMEALAAGLPEDWG